MQRMKFWALTAAMAGLAMGAHSPASAAQSCDRACLRGLLDQYIQATFKHDPGAAPLARSYRATENASELKNGTGIWTTATGYGDIQRHVLDTVGGQAAYYGTLKEGDDTDIVSVRIKVENRKVTEGEWTVARKKYGTVNIEGLTQFAPPQDAILPLSERAPRAEMIAAANAYFQGLQDHDGSKVPHIPGCERVENGGRVTNRPRRRPPPAPPVAGAAAPAPAAAPAAPATQNGQPTLAAEELSGDCAADFEMFKRTILEVSKRRFPVVDEEQGVVLGSTLFHRPPGIATKRNLLSEFFYQKQGKIAGIWAAMYYLDPDAPDSNGWDGVAAAASR